LLLQKGMLHKGSLLFTHIFFLKWVLNHRCKVPIYDIAALRPSCEQILPDWLGNLAFPLKLWTDDPSQLVRDHQLPCWLTPSLEQWDHRAIQIYPSQHLG
jgi:hypothetical protein